MPALFYKFLYLSAPPLLARSYELLEDGKRRDARDEQQAAAMRRCCCCSRLCFSFVAVPPPLAPAAAADAHVAALRGNQARTSLHRKLRPPAPQGLPRSLDRLLVGRGRGDPRGARR